MLLTSIPTGRKVLSIIDVCSAFFSIPVDEGSQYLFAFTWEEKQFTWTVTPQGFTESPYFSQILKADLDEIKFPRGSTFCNMWMIYFFTFILKPSHRDSIHLVKLLALKGHKITKE